MSRKLLIGLSAVAVAAAGAAYAAGHGRFGHGMMKQMVSARIAEAEDYIEATPQQRQVIEASRDTVIGAFEARAQAHKAKQGAILSLLAADTLDVNQLNALVDQKSQEVNEMGHLIVGEVAKVHAVLTPAQRQKLVEKIKERHGHFQGGFGGQ
jgi:Spy/CpxP family protein refolding chaperone